MLAGMAAPGRILVIGAGMPLGLRIVQLLRARGFSVTGAYRTPRGGVEASIAAAGAAAVRLDLAATARLKALLDAHDAAIFTPILTASVAAAPLLRPDQRALFFSSNNVTIDPQDPIYAQLLAAERRLRQHAPQAALLRPTMIYGHPDDRNLSRLMRAARRRRILPCPAPRALQQPVYYRDLAETAVDVLLGEAHIFDPLPVAGPDRLTLARLYSEVARAAGRRVLVLPVPLPLARRAAAVLRGIGVAVPVSDDQLRRAGQNKCPTGDNAITTRTPLREGLRALARELGG